jgi:CRP-like cAMP-binding protein
VLVDTMGKGAFVGEMSLLTGEPRTATVRARDGAVVYEIGARQYAPVLRAHPELVAVLAQLMVDRLRERRRFLDTRQAKNEHAAIVRQIRYALFRT